jgi:hypothetical protein
MELREKIRRAAAVYVPAGEQIQVVIPARFAPFRGCDPLPPMSTSVLDIGGLVFDVLLPLLSDRRRVLVVTSTLIVVLDCGRGRCTSPRSVLAIVPRQTLGPPKGFFRHKVRIAGETLRIQRRFFPDITAVG